jgi:hypothetical protein
MEEQIRDERIKKFSEKMKDKNNRRLAGYAMGFEKLRFFGRYRPIFKYTIYNDDDEDEFIETYEKYINSNDNESLNFVDNILNPEYKKSTDYFLGAYISVGFFIVLIIAILLIMFVWKPSNTWIYTIIISFCLGLLLWIQAYKIVVSAYPFYAWKKTRSNNNKTE